MKQVEEGGLSGESGESAVKRLRAELHRYSTEMRSTQRQPLRRTPTRRENVETVFRS